MIDLAELSCCPFCGGKSRLSTVGRSWYRITSDHDEGCLLEDHEFDAPQTDDQLSLLVRDWNARGDEFIEVKAENKRLRGFLLDISRTSGDKGAVMGARQLLSEFEK